MIRPREWQLRALTAWKGARRGIVEVVTGGGKTIFAFLCMEDFWQQFPDGSVVILVPTVALADQWFVGLQEDAGRDASDVAIFSGREKPTHRKRVNVAVLNTARRIASLLYEGGPTLLIVDECHRAATPMNAKALTGDHSATLGLSATPTREYDEGLEQILIPSLGPVIFRYTYEDAHRDGVITQFQLVNVKCDLLADELTEFERLSQRIRRAAHRATKSGDSAPLKRLLQKRAAVSAGAAMRPSVAVRLTEQHRGKKAIVFHETIRGAERIVEMLRARQHSVAIYHSGIAPNVRRDNLRLFRRGVFDVLVSCRALDEGMNVPETAVAVIAASTASERQRIQRLGRVLRPAAGKESAVIYTIYATPQEEARLARESESLAAFASIAWRVTRLRKNG